MYAGAQLQTGKQTPEPGVGAKRPCGTDCSGAALQLCGAERPDACRHEDAEAQTGLRLLAVQQGSRCPRKRSSAA
jgi:hypothetical protein